MDTPIRRRSVFQEIGLDDLDFETLSRLERTSSSDSGGSTSPHPPPSRPTRRKRPTTGVRFRSTDDIRVVDRFEDDVDLSPTTEHERPANSVASSRGTEPFPAYTSSPLPQGTSMMSRLGVAFLLLAAAAPILHSTSFFGHASLPLRPVRGGPIPADATSHGSVVLDKRADSPTDVCFRWAQQSAVVNGTLYLYGGEATTEPSQTQNTWNNDFLSLDLTKTWQIASPSLTGLPQPSGPPNVSLGYLWNSHESLFLYGGEFDWKPAESPTPFSLWEYSIASASWIDHSDPVTSTGDSAPSNNDPVQRAAEGAGVTVPSLGRGFYFGGHQDGYTTQGWSQSVPRIYLQSLLEFTFPGSSNDQVDALSDNKTAGSDGVYRNITEGGLQSQAGFTQRADGLLVYVPGFGDQGILLALAGGTNDSYTQMNNINVYDIATSSWYVQATSGSTPKVRVNPCAVVAAAADGSSYQIHMFGGQNLIPAGNQTQYNEMWVLTVPAFQWIQVDQSGQSVPYGRSGHTCNIWDAQMVMVGGYTGDDESLTCESPGIYVFDVSALQWVNQFTASSPGADDGSSSDSGSGSTGSNNPFNQQLSQKAGDTFSSGGLEGSYGYEVPDAVISVIGGGKTGGATLTTPINTATAGPLASGKPVTYTVTNTDGSTTTSTSTPGPSSSGNSSGKSRGANVGAIAAGCVAGVLFLIACYLAFCAYVYRKQLQLYKRHAEMSQAQQSRGEKFPVAITPTGGLLAASGPSSTAPPPPKKKKKENQSHILPLTLSPWATSNTSESASSHHSHHSHRSHHSRNESGAYLIPSSSSAAGAGGGTGSYSYASVRRGSEGSADGGGGAEDAAVEELLRNHEPTFFGVVWNPRRSLRVINRD